jgi:hypothetical protein
MRGVFEVASCDLKFSLTKTFSFRTIEPTNGNAHMEKKELKRFVRAPTPAAAVRAGQVTGVRLAPDETVTWMWTHYPDGTSAVTGYRINKKLPRK